MAFETKQLRAKFSRAIVISWLFTATPGIAADPTALEAGNPAGQYNLSYDKDKWNDEFSVFHVGMTDQFGVLDSGVAASDDPRLRPLTRLDTAWTFATPLPYTTSRVGDSVSSTAFWQQPVRMGGLQLGSVQPVLPDIVAPQFFEAPPDASALAATASSRIIERARTVAQLQRDSLEPEGQTDYSLETGLVREDFELRSNDYGSWLTSGTYRYGLYAATTLDAQFAQVAGQQSLLGLGLLQSFGGFGLVSARVASSRDADASGWLARLGYDYRYDNVSLALRSNIQSASYQSSSIASVDPLRQRLLASAGVDLGGAGKLAIASATQTFSDDSRRGVVALSHAMPLTGGGILSTAATYSPGQFAGSALLFSFTYPFDYRNAAARPLTDIVDISLDRSITDSFNQMRPLGTGRADALLAPQFLWPYDLSAVSTTH